MESEVEIGGVGWRMGRVEIGVCVENGRGDWRVENGKRRLGSGDLGVWRLGCGDCGVEIRGGDWEVDNANR